MYQVLKIMHMLNFLDTFSVGVTRVVVETLFFINENLPLFRITYA